jgi:6-phosphofructokinase 1
VLATRYGARAAEVVAEGGFGRMVAILGNKITDIPLSDAVSELKTVPESVYGKAEMVIAGP